MPTFYLDGQPIEFEAGETILAAARRYGREIPHYCYHPGLQVTAQCRMCLVDVVDAGNGNPIPKLQTSCSTPAAEGMKVDSRNEKVKAGQNTVNEFLLVNHPLDCPICDQAGECDLQNFAFKYGTGHSEMEYEKRVYGWREVGSFLVLERNRCIHCSRCERFSRDVEGSHDFGMFLRSHELTFDTYEDEQISHKFQGNLADICPVGAIMNRDWRFKKRAWKLKKTPSVCTSCSTGCNITVEQEGGRIYRYKPRENQAVNRWWMCDEGRVGFHHLNDHTRRTLEPQARVQGRLRDVSWDAVYGAVAKRLTELKASGAQVVGLADTFATNEELFLLKQLLADGFGSDTVLYPHVEGRQQEQPPHDRVDPFLFTLITTDKSPNTAGAKALGLTPDTDGAAVRSALGSGTKVVFILGAPFAGNDAIRQAVQQAALVVQIGTFHSRWLDVADVILPGLTEVEREGTYTNKAGRVQRIGRALKPPAACRAQTTIMTELLGAMGKEIAPMSAGELFDTLAGQDGPFKGLRWDAVGAQGAALPGA